MTRLRIEVPWFLFLQNELRLSWRQQQRLFGKAGALISPYLLLSLYIILNISFALFHLVTEANPAQTHIAYSAYGWALISIWLYLVASTVAPIAEMINGQSDWDVIVSSPHPLRSIVIIRLSLIAVRALALPMLVLSPAINVRILCGEPVLLQFYPALVALGLGAIGISTLVAFLMPAQTSLATAKKSFAFIGLGMIGVLLVASLLRNNITFIALVIETIESSHIFLAVDWLGTGIFGALLPLAALCLIGAGFFIATFGPIRARVLERTMRFTAISSANLQRGKLVFADSLLLATIRKEWRLARRDWRFFLDFLREVIILSTILILVHNEAKTSFTNAAATLSASICAVIANDLSWRMAAVEQLPDLIATSPVDASSILNCKLIAASIPPFIMLIVLCLALAFWAPQTVCLTLVCGSCAIGGASFLNGRRDPIDCGIRGSRIKQGAVAVLIQALNVFSWGLILYFALASSARIAFALIAIGFAATACIVLLKRHEALRSWLGLRHNYT